MISFWGRSDITLISFFFKLDITLISTANIEKRLNEHCMGLTPCYTKKRRPLELVFLQTFTARYDALVAEQQIKKWCRSKKEALIAQNWSLLSQLASRSIKK